LRVAVVEAVLVVVALAPQATSTGGLVLVSR